MQLKKLTLEDKELFKKYSNKKDVTSQYAGFVNLFIWQKIENIHYFIHNEKLFVTGISGKKRYFMFPDATIIKKEDIQFLKENFKEEWSIECLSEADMEHLLNECGDILTFSHIRDMDNYIYLTENLINLSGKKYHSKKNHVNSFKKKYDYRYIKYTEDMRSEVMNFLGKWYINKTEEGLLMGEANSIVRAIDNYKELGLKGGMITVQGKIVAFSMGEKMTEDMAVIHFEKADTDYSGAYAIINNEFLKNEWTDTKYVNREEDMGIEGLRKSKLSYKPDILFPIYSAKLK